MVRYYQEPPINKRIMRRWCLVSFEEASVSAAKVNKRSSSYFPILYVNNYKLKFFCHLSLHIRLLCVTPLYFCLYKARAIVPVTYRIVHSFVILLIRYVILGKCKRMEFHNRLNEWVTESLSGRNKIVSVQLGTTESQKWPTKKGRGIPIL